MMHLTFCVIRFYVILKQLCCTVCVPRPGCGQLQYPLPRQMIPLDLSFTRGTTVFPMGVSVGGLFGDICPVRIVHTSLRQELLINCVQRGLTRECIRCEVEQLSSSDENFSVVSISTIW